MAALAAQRTVSVEPATARLGALLALLVGFEFVLGVMTMFSVPFSRPSGWLPTRGEVVFIVHAVFGLLLAVAAVALIVSARGDVALQRPLGWGSVAWRLQVSAGSSPMVNLSAWFFGMALMFVGPMLAGFGYMVPILLSSSHRVSAPSGG